MMEAAGSLCFAPAKGSVETGSRISIDQDRRDDDDDSNIQTVDYEAGRQQLHDTESRQYDT